MSRFLVKIAGELSVGTATLVEFLNKKGYEIENKPNAKVTDDMYSELTKEFQKSIEIKDASRQVNIGVARPKTEPEPAAPVKKEPETASNQEVDFRVKLQQPKIVGKIDLSGSLKPKAEQAQSNPEPATPVKKETPAAPVEAPVAQTPLVPVQPVASTPSAPVEPVKPKVDATTPSVEQAQGESEEDKNYRAETPELRGLKIMGKINIDSFDRSGKKKDKPKEQNRDRRPNQGGQQGGPNQGQPRQDRPDRQGGQGGGNSNNQDRRPQGQGGQGGGQDRRPQGQGGQGQQGGGQDRRPQGQGGQGQGNQGGGQGQNNNNNEGRNKRKRVIVSAANGQPSNNTQGSGNQGPRQDRGQGGGGNMQNRRPQQGNQQGGNRMPQNRGGNDQQEVSQREIDEKLKATLARLTGGGGKKKRQKLQRDKRERFREKQEIIDQEAMGGKLQVTEFISVSELASIMDVAVTEVIMACMSLGVMVSINQRLDAEIIELVAGEFGHEVEFISVDDQVDDESEVEDAEEDLSHRAPIVTVMGHVDHGKTSLLDYIRKTNVVKGEAGGITQHIGAYEVRLDGGRKITFLDTPGHEAFTAMRARGAKVTDIAIIIIAADDSIMPQTREAISHAQAAGVPMVFAINKVDKAGAQPEKIKQELASMNLLVEDWGGKYQSQDISAKSGLGIPELLEKILLEAELLELKANPDRQATGTVLEATLDKGRGYVTKMLVQNGTLNVGDIIVAGEFSGRVRAMLNDQGVRVDKAGPATPVMVLGLSGAPQAGDLFKVYDNEQDARQIASKRSQISREQANRATKRISLDEIGRRLALGNFKELNLIVKCDVDGSVEALSDSLMKLSIEKVQVNVIHRGVGQINESDVLLASTSDAIIIGFQVRPSSNARKVAEKEGVEIKTYSVIYDAIEEVKAAIEGMLEPTKEEKITGLVEIRVVYRISKVGTVAGCQVVEGKIMRNNHIRVVRDGIVVFPTREGAHGEVASLKRIKEDVREVKNGLECGVSIKNFNDIQEGDIIEAYEITEIKQRLD
jgi:translation initiation factor IF-2